MNIFNTSKTRKQITNSTISDAHYELLEKWKAVYAGFYSEWHDAKYHTLNGVRKRRMKTLNIAKVACEELAKLIFNEKVEINISDDKFKDNIDNVFKYNRFYKVMQGKIEQMFALGGFILKAQLNDEGNNIRIVYATPDSFIPISWENGEITECAFLNITRKGDKVYCLFEFHEWKVMDDNKKYVIRNELYVSDKNISVEHSKKVPLDELYQDLDEITVVENLTQQLFTYIKPNIANNFDLSSPMGISIFANSMDTLQAIDVAFDSFFREFRLGRKRIIVPSSAVRSVVDPQTGTLNRYFDADDEVYQAFNFDNPDSQKIIDNSVSLRVDDHISAINSLLNLLSMQIGFSAGTFTFDGQGVKTATEIVSEKSKTYQTKQVNENLIEEGLEKFVSIIGEVAGLYNIFTKPDDYEIEFSWDDSVIQDRDADTDHYIKLLSNSLISKTFTLMKVLDLTEEQAQEMLDKIKEENESVTPTMDDILNSKIGTEEKDDSEEDEESKDDK